MTPSQNNEAHGGRPELAALADGTLTGRRRERLEAEVARSPELAAQFAEQQRAVQAVRSLDVNVPERLRERVEAERATAATRGRGGRDRRPSAREREPRVAARRRRLGFGLALAGATAAAALVVALSLPGGAGGPSVVEAAELGTRPATEPAPRPSGPKLLAASADGLPFPDWADKFGWEAVGERRDELDGREAVTVFYEKGARRIAYTILSGSALEAPSSYARAVREGTPLRYRREDDGRLIVTWERDGRTCVLTGSDIPANKLLDLAGWRGLGDVPF